MYVYRLDVRDLTNKKVKEYGKLYYAILQGAYDYIFDNHKKKDNLVLVVFENGQRRMEMRMVEFLFHLIIWRAHVTFQEPIRPEDFYQVHPLTPGVISNIMDNIIERFTEKYDSDKVADCISRMFDFIAKVSRGYSSIAGNTFSIWDVMKLEERSHVFRQLVNTQLDERIETKVHEKFLEQARGELIKAIRSDGKSALLAYFESKRIDITQGGQMFIAVGPRPNVDKTVLPKIIRGNFLRGLQSASEYYVESVSARDALITKDKNIRNSGYLSRKMNLLCLDTMIEYRPMRGDPHGIHYDCGTTHVLQFLVADKNFLRSIVGKFYYNEKGRLTIVKKDDEHLIGKVLALRSHIKCSHVKQGFVCPVCFGSRSRIVRGTRIGALPSIKIANPISQKAMSAKHKTGTNSVEVTNEIIKKYFHIKGQDLFLKDEFGNRNDLFFGIREEDFASDSEDTDFGDETTDFVSSMTSVFVFDGENEYLMENEKLSMALSHFVLENNLDDFITDKEDGMILLPAKILDTEEPVFSMTLISEEITRYLMEVTKIIDGSKTKNYTQVEVLIQDCLRILNDAGIHVNLIHMETMFYNMLRVSSNKTIRPNFSQTEIEYDILSLSQSIYLKDTTTALSFDRLKDRFEDIRTYKKTGTGIFDPFFRARLFDTDIPRVM